ncbi:MAG: hypothetical protein D6785_03790 [Planctomycetota bacterium]|nr:MAG: hypothetical protein D6785_03790 [Planctomycetota bacterium]
MRKSLLVKKMGFCILMVLVSFGFALGSPTIGTKGKKKSSWQSAFMRVMLQLRVKFINEKVKAEKMIRSYRIRKDYEKGKEKIGEICKKAKHKWDYFAQLNAYLLAKKYGSVFPGGKFRARSYFKSRLQSMVQMYLLQLYMALYRSLRGKNLFAIANGFKNKKKGFSKSRGIVPALGGPTRKEFHPILRRNSNNSSGISSSSNAFTPASGSSSSLSPSPSSTPAPSTPSSSSAPNNNLANTNGLVIGIDISHWTGNITSTHAHQWKNAGVQYVIVGTQRPDVSRQQISVLLAAGMKVDLYIYIYWNAVNYSLATQLSNAFKVAQGFPIERIWLDLEDTPPSYWGVSKLKQTISDLVREIEKKGYKTGIYTGAWWWNKYLPGVKDFAHLPLWYAWYDKVNNLSTWNYQHFGGWAKPAGKQYQGSTNYFGGARPVVDLNVFDPAFFGSSSPKKQPRRGGGLRRRNLPKMY